MGRMSRGAKEAIALACVSAVGLALFVADGWGAYAERRDLDPSVAAVGDSVENAQATWGPLELRDVTDQRRIDDPLPEGMRIVWAVIPVTPHQAELDCSVDALIETVPPTDPDPARARSWASTSIAGLDDSAFPHKYYCDAEWPVSRRAELAMPFLVPADAARDLQVSITVRTYDDESVPNQRVILTGRL